MRVLFWGTPEFATPALRALTGEGFDVVGVVTQPDKAVGRSRSTFEPPPVKRLATDEGIPVFQPARPRGDEFIAHLRGLEPDISVVVAYGQLLPRDVIELPRHGTINIHASLLPKLRGAAPVQAAILEGYQETGVTIMQMVEALDAGPSLLQVRTPIPDDETHGELSLRLSEMGALAMIEALTLIDLGAARPVPQDDAIATYAPKIDRVRTRLDWNADARTVWRAIRAYDPRPGAVTQHRGADLKLFGASLAERAADARPGQITSIDASGMTVACGASGHSSSANGAVRVSALLPAGKRRLTPAEWSRGRGIAEGDQLF